MEQQTFQIIVEALSILISVYFIYLSKKFISWKRYILLIIAIAVIIIDIYALLSWGIVNILPKDYFHMVTQFLGLPAGIVLIYLSRHNIQDRLGSISLGFCGCCNLVVDGSLFLTWF